MASFPMPISQYRCPVAKTSTAYKLSWLREARDEAWLYLQNQPGFAQLEEDRRIADRHFPDMFRGIMGGAISPGGGITGPMGTPADQRVHVPEVKRMLSEMCAILGNIEPSWTYGSRNEELRDISDILDRCKKTWWERTFSIEKIVECLQWSVVNRSGYIFPTWNPRFHGTPQRGVQNGDIELRVGGPEDYLPLWPDSSHDIQKAYAGTIRVKMPITQFAATWPTLAESVYPDDEQPAGLTTRIIEGAGRLFRPDNDRDIAKPGRVPTVTVYWTYIYDQSTNITGNTVPMGVKGTHTYYEVPAFGSDIPTGLINLNTGNDLTRKAEQIDTYLYPWLRLVIWTEQVICYDGPSYWFHGKIPAVKLTVDPWPWSYLGGSLVRDIASMEEAANRALKSIDMREQLRPNPPKQVNESNTDTTSQQDIPRILKTPGGLFKVTDFRDGDVVRPMTNPDDFQVNQWEIEYIKYLRDSMMDVLGLNNFQRMSELRQMPSGDTSEKMLQITGARTQRKGNLMEKFCLELAPIVGGLMLQWYDSEFRYMLHGYKGIAKYDFDFDPQSLVPADLPGGEYELNSRRKLPADRRSRDHRSGMFDTRAKRARYLISIMGTNIERGSLLDVTSMTHQLEEMRLWTDPTCPKDPITLFESLKFNNVGTMDDTEEMDTRMGRARKWRRIVTEELLEEQKQAAEIQQGATPEGKAGMAIRDLVTNAVAQSNGERREGRPSTFAQPPQLRVMNRPDGTQDTVIDTSSNR